VPQEAPAIVEKNRPPAYWPSSNGELHVEKLVVQYAPHLPPVLRNISFTVHNSEKIGVVRDSLYSVWLLLIAGLGRKNRIRRGCIFGLVLQ
jgi:hypothetical protein